MADEENRRIIKLKGSETATREFEISAEAAILSDLLRNSLDDSDSEKPQVIDFRNHVSTDTLAKVVDFMVHYAQEAMTEIHTTHGGSSFNEIVKQVWYREFMVNMERPMLFDVVTAANYMAVTPLLNLACLKVTFELTGKSADEIREILNLPDLTPEEEARARNEHPWIFETS
jgi:S-phase kinase-associated protein 1